MINDPTIFILAAALIGACIGFFGCSIFASSRIRSIEDDSFQAGYECCNRDHHNRSRDQFGKSPLL